MHFACGYLFLLSKNICCSLSWILFLFFKYKQRYCIWNTILENTINSKLERTVNFTTVKICLFFPLYINCLYPPDFVISCPTESTCNYTFHYKPTPPYFAVFRNKGNKGYRSFLFSLLNYSPRLNFLGLMFTANCETFVKTKWHL